MRLVRIIYICLPHLHRKHRFVFLSEIFHRELLKLQYCPHHTAGSSWLFLVECSKLRDRPAPRRLLRDLGTTVIDEYKSCQTNA